MGEHKTLSEEIEFWKDVIKSEPEVKFTEDDEKLYRIFEIIYPKRLKKGENKNV